MDKENINPNVPIHIGAPELPQLDLDFLNDQAPTVPHNRTLPWSSLLSMATQELFEARQSNLRHLRLDANPPPSEEGSDAELLLWCLRELRRLLARSE